MTGSIRILIVSKETDFVETVTTSLEEHRDTFAITTASSASDGMELLRDDDDLDCVVSAYDLPGKDGVAFLETVREKYQRLPFVLYPRNGDEAVAAAAISADVTDYLPRADSADQHTSLAQTIEGAVAGSDTAISMDSRRERQLSELHKATRELLNSETPHQVATTASQTAVDILDLPLNGIHFYDEAAGGLAPTAVSDASQELFGEVPVIDEGIAWKVFQSGEEQIYNDIAEASEVYNSESPIRGEIHLPLVDHGVFIISATEENAFEETDIELGRLLAANTEAALKRVSKEQQLQARETALEQQNERLEEFASIVSHDLRNPLNVAQSRTEFLTEECDNEHLSPIEQALDRMEELISDTLTLAKQGNIVAETESIQVTNLVGKCWKTVSTNDATIEIVDPVTITGDRSRLQHVFENLFRNAIEHGGTDVTVRVGRIAGDGIYVEDTGSGIPEVDREAVFEPGHTSATGGTGFGLTIVKRIAEAHGWDVAITDGTDGGARFEFTAIDIIER